MSVLGNDSGFQIFKSPLIPLSSQSQMLLTDIKGLGQCGNYRNLSPATNQLDNSKTAVEIFRPTTTKMKTSVMFALLMCIAVAAAIKYGDTCAHTGDQNKDDAQCSGVNNNMLCGTGNKCVCLDEYGASSDKFKPAPDNQACVKA